MDTAEYIRTLFDSLYWARDRVLDAAEGMTEEEYARENGFVYKSIRGIFTHTLGAEANYMRRASGQPALTPDSPDAINEQTVPTIEALKARWLREEQAMRAFLGSLTTADLDEVITFTRRDGVEVRQARWEMLTTVLEHTMQHRSEAAEALTMVGRSPGGLDFPMYVASKAT